MRFFKAGLPPLPPLAILLLVACGGGIEPDDRIGVIVTIPPQAEFVERIGGGLVRVDVLVPPGANPHTYEPTPGQLAAISRAVLYAKVGTPLEFENAWLDRIIEVNPTMGVVDCSRGVDLIATAESPPSSHGRGGRIDPHIWTSPLNAAVMVRNIAGALAAADTANAGFFRRNAEAYIEELLALDRSIEEALSGKRTRIFITFHPAWGYLARRYGLSQMAIEAEGKEPSARWIAQLVDRARSGEIRVIFASPEFNAESAEVIANEIGGRVVLVSPLERGYLANLERVARELSAVLE